MANNTKGTLKYRKVKRIPPLGENAGKEKWYATVVTDRELSFEDFVNHISALRASRRCTSSCATPAPGATRSSARSASSRSTTPSALTTLRPTRPALATTEAQAAPAPIAAPPTPEALAPQEALKAPEAATANRHPAS